MDQKAESTAYLNKENTTATRKPIQSLFHDFSIRWLFGKHWM